MQAALDSASLAFPAATDLIVIAYERKPHAKVAGRAGRTDARQRSLYRALIAARTAAGEESFEALTFAGTRALGLPQSADAHVRGMIGRGPQSPRQKSLKPPMKGFLDFDPTATWRATLSFSEEAHKRIIKKG